MVFLWSSFGIAFAGWCFEVLEDVLSISREKAVILVDVLSMLLESFWQFIELEVVAGCPVEFFDREFIFAFVIDSNCNEVV